MYPTTPSIIRRPNNNADFLETKPAELIVQLVKAVQQLSDRLDALES